MPLTPSARAFKQMERIKHYISIGATGKDLELALTNLYGYGVLDGLDAASDAMNNITSKRKGKIK